MPTRQKSIHASSRHLRAVGASALLLCTCSAQAEPATAAWTDPVSGIEFVLVNGGCAELGAPTEAKPIPGQDFAVPSLLEVPVRKVCIKPLWVGKTEVTWAQWQRVDGAPAAGTFTGTRPVTDVSWQEARGFAERLGQLGGAGHVFRLPTAGEWEYLCREGRSGHDQASDGEERIRLIEATEKVAVYLWPRRKDAAPLPVASRQANAFGLHDMMGNVWEWVADDPPDARYNSGATRTAQRMMRGGSYRSELEQTRCGAVNRTDGDDRLRTVGFRLVREVK